jgi:hypothetical protein
MNFGLFVLDTWSGLGVVALILDVAALASIWKGRKHAMRAKLIWTVMVAVLPLLGAVAWFALGREPRPSA